MQAKSTWTITPIRTVSNTPFYAMQLFLDHVTTIRRVVPINMD
nr:hypothetical protein [Listeria booriae]